MTNNTDRNLNNCSFAKGVLLLIIIISHSLVFWRGDWFTAIKPIRTLPGTDVMVGFVSNFHVYAFTLVSGYIFYYLK